MTPRKPPVPGLGPLLVWFVMALSQACSTPRSEFPAPQDGGSAGTAEVSPPSVPQPMLDGSAEMPPSVPTGSRDAASSDRPVAPPDMGCPAGRHLCAGICVDSNSIDSCGDSCVPCPTATGGSATCDGRQCGITCPAGMRICEGSCTALATPCGQACPAGEALCDGRCVDFTKDKDHCGRCKNVCLAGCAGGSCICPTASPANLVRNPGFTSNADGWTRDATITASWTKDDAAACPSSGAMILRTPGLPANQSESVWQCIPVSPGTTYNYGVWRKEPVAPGGRSYGFISLFWYRSADCRTSQVGYENSPGPAEEAEWSLHAASAVAPAAATHAQFTLGIVGSHEATFDMPYLSPAPGRF